MSHDVFISWSGKDSRSHQVALALRDWLPNVIQTISCFVSSHDIDAGELWLDQILTALTESKCGVLCLSPEVMDKPWVAFEAGALIAKFERTRVVPLLIGHKAENVKYPFQALQCKALNKEGVMDIVRMLNTLPMRTPLSEIRLDESFAIWWPKLEAQLHAIAKSTADQVKVPKLTSEDKLDEMLGLVRSLQQHITATTVPSAGDVSPSRLGMETGVYPDVFQKLVDEVMKRRPLIVAWLESASHARVDSQRFLHVYFPPSESHSEASLKRDATMKFMTDVVQNHGYAGIRLHLLPN